MVSITHEALGCVASWWLTRLCVEILVASGVKTDNAHATQVSITAHKAFRKPVVVTLVRHCGRRSIVGRTPELS